MTPAQVPFPSDNLPHNQSASAAAVPVAAAAAASAALLPGAQPIDAPAPPPSGAPPIRRFFPVAEGAEVEEDDLEISSTIQIPVGKLKILLEYGTQTKCERNINLCFSSWPVRNSFSFYMTVESPTEKSTQITSETAEKCCKKKEKATQVYSAKNSLPMYQFDDRQFRAFCGVGKQIAQFLSLLMGPSLTDGRLMSRDLKITLLLTKLKLNCSFSALSGFYGISDSLARKIFFGTLDILFCSVKNFIIWFDRPTIKARMPKAFRALFPDTRVIIDCSEIECETPAKISQKVLLWSNYKSRYTAKFLVGIAPSGEVTFVSKGFGGRATDAQITVASGFLDLLEEGDIVMSDKGFPLIETEVNRAGGVLLMPPFRRGERQFTAKENKDGYLCASVRIHVERCIRRLKVFHILKFLPLKMLPHFNKILIVICFLNNCLNDLIHEEEEEGEEVIEEAPSASAKWRSGGGSESEKL